MKFNHANKAYGNTIRKIDFADCVGLKRIVLAENVTKISTDMFDGCFLLRDVVMNG